MVDTIRVSGAETAPQRHARVTFCVTIDIPWTSCLRSPGRASCPNPRSRMSKLPLTLASDAYDRTQALRCGDVHVDGVDLNYLCLPVEETFHRMVRNEEFDAAELSLSTYVLTLESPDPPFVAIPVFPSRS